MSVKNDDLPSASDLKSEISSFDQASLRAEISFESEFRRLSLESERAYVHVKGLIDHYIHKGYWSWFLIFLMTVMISFQCFLLWQVGVGAWDFSKYQWLLPLLLAQNLAQIVGLAVFVVRSLFKDMN